MDGFIDGCALQVGSATTSAAPSASVSSSGGSTTLVTPVASATGSITAARRSRFGGRSQSVESLTTLDNVIPEAVLQAGRANRFSMFSSGKLLQLEVIMGTVCHLLDALRKDAACATSVHVFLIPLLAEVRQLCKHV